MLSSISRIPCFVLLLLTASLSGACSGTLTAFEDDAGASSTDAGPAADAGPTFDAAVADADAGATDAGATDAGATDAGELDAGVRDAGPADAGLGIPGAFEAVFAGPQHSCGITSGGRTFCWGRDASKQLGELDDADDLNEALPVEVNLAPLGSERLVSLALGSSHTCGITQLGNAYCWGDDGLGQVGNGVQAFGNVEAAPARVLTNNFVSGELFTGITAGSNYTCAATDRNKAYCWGQGAGGRLGQDAAGIAVHEPSPVDTSNLASAETFTQVVAGKNYACGLTNQGSAYCWGAGGKGQFGTGTPISNQLVPTKVDDSPLSSGEYFTQIACELFHTCAVTNLGFGYCWGSNPYGNLGDDSEDDSALPVRVVTSMFNGGENVAAVSVGSNHSCLRTSLGRVLCFGFNNHGQLGNGRSSPILPGSFVPAPVVTTNFEAGESMLSISTGPLHNCALGDSGTAYCWGGNDDAQIGNGAATDPTEEPTAVSIRTVGR